MMSVRFGECGAWTQHRSCPHPGLGLAHIDVQQLGDQPVIHRRHPPSLRFQALEHRQHLAVVERAQRRRLQCVAPPSST
jgi:hypothetical protein